MQLVSRVWNLRLRWHIGALALIFCASGFFVGTNSISIVDEGSVLLQAKDLVHSHSWIVPDSFPAADQQGHQYPLEAAECGSKGCAAYVKQPVYELVVASIYNWFGVGGVLALSMFGTIAAACFGAVLAKRVLERSEKWVFWAIGLGSPLFIDGTWATAHTLAAATCVLTVLAIANFLRAKHWIWLVIGGVSLVACVTTRSEAAFVPLGFLVALSWIAWRERSKRAVIAAGTVLIAGVIGKIITFVLELWAIGKLAKSSTSLGNWTIGGRPRAFTDGLINTGTQARGSVPIILALVVLIVLGLIIRLRPRRGDLIAFLATIAGLSVFFRVIMAGNLFMRGLFLTSPILAPGLVNARKVKRSEFEMFFAATVSAVVICGVAATQYDTGGGTEWGGRYFAVIVPLLVFLAVVFLMERLSAVSVSSRYFVGTSLVVCSCLLAVSGINATHVDHNAVAQLRQEILRRSEQTPSGDGGKPVVLSPNGLPARISWREYENRRWLLVQTKDFQGAAERLHELGIKTLTIVVLQSPKDEKLLSKDFQLSHKQTSFSWVIYKATPKSLAKG